MDSMKRVFVRIKNEIQNMLLAIFALSSILILALFIIKPSVNILAYENSFEFYNSNVNRLYIKISGRMKILENNVEKTFILLENHPRENTFDNNVQPYSDMIKSSDGASFISFIMGNDGSSVIERRYQSKQSEDIRR